MVRVNLLRPEKLSDQHLVAEYLEIMMLVGYVRKHPDLENIPETFRLGKGHIKFFKDKLLYLKERHETLKGEMKKRGFATNKTLDIKEFSEKHKNNFNPGEGEKNIIKKRIREKILKKPNYYRYYGEYKKPEFFFDLMDLTL